MEQEIRAMAMTTNKPAKKLEEHRKGTCTPNLKELVEAEITAAILGGKFNVEDYTILYGVERDKD